jgi:hypothetical protein
MRTTTKKKQQPATPGFAILLGPGTPLGLAMLVAEDEEGHYEPVAVASTINEARELASSDWGCRMHRLEHDEDPGICPYEYKLWAQGLDGDYRIALTITQEEL